VASDWLRARKFIGGSDRRAIVNRVWGVLRARAQLAWWLGREHLEATPRSLVLADAVLRDAWPGHAIEEAFDGGQHRPDRLSAEEKRALERMSGNRLDHPDQPDSVRLNIPDWIEPELRAAFGEGFARELEGLAQAAPVDLRANPLKGTREDAQAALAAENVPAELTALSPLGLRLRARTSVVAGPAFRSGLVEVQDEGSQLVALLVGARPGDLVLDWCAGAGGKTLAIAAGMANKGRVVACDTSGGRLDRSAVRLRRAGVHNVERRVLDAEGRRWAKRNAAKFDRVLVDAPCSGTGTWRRNPDGRWTLVPQDVAELQVKQAEILDAAARMVKPGGRLLYATCSLLPVENERQAEAFLARNATFAAVPAAQAWQEAVGTAAPHDATAGPWLRLTPARHGTDGFFAAVFERAKSVDAASTGSSGVPPAS
jgi:16S rRNA (cytosine967-C5)-methyltransferase